MPDPVLLAVRTCSLYYSCHSYHNTITGEVITVAVCSTMAVIGVWLYIRNFVQHKSTAADL